jgi:two-component system NtrC family sensor kinase
MTAGRQLPPLPLERAPDEAAAQLDRLRAEISDLRAQNEALREQLTLRDQALDATPTFFVITEQSGPEPIIVYCNKVVADEHGYRRDELIGRSVALLTQWVGHDASYVSIVNAELRAGRTFSFESQVKRRNGSQFWLGVSIRPIFNAAGSVTHSVAMGADISAKLEENRKKQELQDKLVAEMKERARVVIELQLAQKLESVGRLAAGVAHEINTPIQYVGDGVYFLRSAYEDFNRLLDSWRSAVDALPAGPAHDALRGQFAGSWAKYDMDFLRAEIPKAFERTSDGVQRVTNIVKAMKEFAHPDTNEQSPADLSHAIEMTLLVASNEYKYLAKVNTEFAELPPVVCNIGELNQVFLNLIVNAAHAIHDAGRDSSTGEIAISTAMDGDAVVIRVRDNGCGIAAENLPKLYDPFFTTKEVGRGTGQGLAITHSIVVDKHGGQIGVSSSAGKGTEFTLHLPIGGRAAKAHA